MRTLKVYDKLIRAVQVKTGNVQYISQYIAEDIDLLERYGYKIDDIEYFEFKNDKKTEVNKNEADGNGLKKKSSIKEK